MAKSLDNVGAEKPADAPEVTTNEAEQAPEKAGPSLLLIQALGEHAEQQGLEQAEGEEEIAFAVRCIEKLVELVDHWGASKQQFEEELRAAKRSLASQRGATTKAKSRIVELEEAGKPRKFGPMAAVFGDEAEAFTVDDLMTAIDGADELVLAFSDGINELRGVKPRQVRAEAFRLTRGRLLFTDEPLEVTGPGDAETVTQLVGVALLVDGEQVAWSAMPQPINIGAGQTINLAGSVIFG